jgi:hypothetical protein
LRSAFHRDVARFVMPKGQRVDRSGCYFIVMAGLNPAI